MLCAACVIDGSTALLRELQAKEIAPPSIHTPRVRAIVQHASQLSGMALSTIVGSSRFKAEVRVRKAIVWVAVRATEQSTPQIGRVLGGRDHSTVIHARDTAGYLYDRDPEFAWLCERLWAAAEAVPLGPALSPVPEPEPTPEPAKKVYQVASVRREPGEYEAPHALPWMIEAEPDEEEDRLRRADAQASVAFLAALRSAHPERFAV